MITITKNDRLKIINTDDEKVELDERSNKVAIQKMTREFLGARLEDMNLSNTYYIIEINNQISYVYYMFKIINDNTNRLDLILDYYYLSKKYTKTNDNLDNNSDKIQHHRGSVYLPQQIVPAQQHKRLSDFDEDFLRNNNNDVITEVLKNKGNNPSVYILFYLGVSRTKA
jgi:hypothetical protein